jgi:hypothetical protein
VAAEMARRDATRLTVLSKTAYDIDNDSGKT